MGGGGERKKGFFRSAPPPPLLLDQFFARSFFAPKPHGNNACCTGCTSCYIDIFQIIQNYKITSFNYTATGYIEIIKQVYSIIFYVSFLFYAKAFKHMLCL